ncbi:hypothetical protein [Streptomyces sp. N35]|uniref:TadE/TadG family type IV pilus assembly protein n=1 Tax=Streptomyces sp. N35 TaxID=2795730 RepID=UPI0027DAB797|nr:hypothetical protein [Streptomyces sp. N35]
MIQLKSWIRARRWDDDRGGIAVHVAIITMPLLALGGLLTVDAFGVLRSHERADALAMEAARAGSQAIDGGEAVSGDAIAVEPAAAAAAARDYLASAGKSGTVRITNNGRRIEVTVTDTYDGAFTPTNWQITGRSSATLLHGITQPED